MFLHLNNVFNIIHYLFIKADVLVQKTLRRLLYVFYIYADPFDPPLIAWERGEDLKVFENECVLKVKLIFDLH